MRLLFALGLGLFITACSISPEHKNTLMQYFNEQLASGTISQTQYDALVAALSGDDWSQVTEILLNLGLSAITLFTGVRLWRGPATKAENVVKVIQAKAAGVKA